MKIFDRFTGKQIESSNLPINIVLGQFAIIEKGTFIDLSRSIFKPTQGQFVNQDLLDPKYKDQHLIFENISDNVDEGKFTAIPLLQGIKKGLKFGRFETELEKELYHIEAIFHSPYTKLSRSSEKVPVSKAKRISNKSYDYLAAHTEDWLHKGLTSFHPSRIITEEIIVNEDVYENRLLIAFVIKAVQYLERRISHTKDISLFIKDYAALLEKNSQKQGWYKRIEREMDLAGKVYDEDSGNYKAVTNDAEIVGTTQRRLEKLRESLLSLRQYDLFYNVSVPDINTIKYRDTNVLVNHQHYRFLKELWLMLITEDHIESDEDKQKADDILIKNVRAYGLSIINYALLNKRYLGYIPFGNDKHWYGEHDNYPKINLNFDESGIINLSIGNNIIRFSVVCSMPSRNFKIPNDTFVLYYDNSENDGQESQATNEHYIPISLKDISSVERIAIIIRKFLFKDYLNKTIFLKHKFPRILRPYIHIIKKQCKYIKIDENNDFFTFVSFPEVEYNWLECETEIKETSDFGSRGRQNQKQIVDAFEHFKDNYALSSMQLIEDLKCFDTDCLMKFESWFCNDLSYIECPCGYVIDSTNNFNIKFFKKNEPYSKEEMGMDYIELNMGN